jgi:hypothetical protein
VGGERGQKDPAGPNQLEGVRTAHRRGQGAHHSSSPSHPGGIVGMAYRGGAGLPRMVRP